MELLAWNFRKAMDLGALDSGVSLDKAVNETYNDIN
jgi:hypothetical protein